MFKIVRCFAKKKMTRTFRLPFLFLMLAASNSYDIRAANNAGTGSLVYSQITKINGRPKYGIHVQNLATGKTRVFQAVDYIEGGVSVSNTGVIAQLQNQVDRDTVLIRWTKLDGTLIRELTYTEQYSFPKGGVRISRDGSVVAFTLNTILGNDKRGDRVVTCETKPTNRDCVYFDNLSDPSWLPDNRLVGINYGRQIYLSDTAINFANPASNNVTPVGPNNLDRAETAETTPDGRKVLFSNNSGVPRVYMLDLARGTVKQLTSAGIGQYRPVASPDGKALFFVQECCQKTPGSAGRTATRGAVHRIALNTEVTTATPYAQNYLRNDLGKAIGAAGRYGLTLQVLK
jgi:hypothetical protein